MAKNHIKTINAPKTWDLPRKNSKFVKRPNPGPHTLNTSVSLQNVIRDMLKLAKTARETRYILNKKNVLVNKIRRKTPDFPVGLIDTVEIVETENSYRMLFNKKGKLALYKINKEDTNKIIATIRNKTFYKGKIQLNLSNGMNLLVDGKDYKTFQSILLEMPDKKITDMIDFVNGCSVYLAAGKHIGTLGKLEAVKGNTITVKFDDGSSADTLKKYGIAVGKDKPAINMGKEQ